LPMTRRPRPPPLFPYTTLFRSRRAQPLEKLNDFNEDNVVRSALQNWPEAAAWVPLMARVKPMVVLLGENKSDVIAVVDLNPWHRSEEHTSELQSRENLVCRLLL